MSVLGKDAVQIHRIRTAGLSRVRAAALRAGLDRERIDRDFAILKSVANGSVATAAEKNRVTKSAVRHTLKKYEGYANKILENDKRRGLYDAAVGK